MSRFILVSVAVVLLCVWAIGCGDDGPAAPAPTPGPTTGTVVVNPSPDSLVCPWQLTGPSSYSHDGTDEETLTDLAPGDYTLTWVAVAGWNLPDPASQTMTLAAGKTVTFSGTYTVAVAEAVSDPDAPGGPTAGVENQDLSYNAAGAVSNHGHAVEYRFDWDDGSFSDWGTIAVQHSWAAVGSYDVKAQARCVAHPAVESGWSAATAVTISVFVVETVSAPAAPTGAATIQQGLSAGYTTSGAVSSYGDDLQYRFDWGDGNFSTWSTLTSSSHAWATVGTYDVKAQARCDAHPTIVSDWSDATVVTITAAPGEIVSAPDAPGGPAAGETNVSLLYTASGAVSTSGHSVEYRFDFGDGTVTGWLFAQTSLAHSFTTAGSYDVIVQARCRTHTTIESAWSAATTVVISEPAEMIPSLPGAINGIAAGIINDPYDYTVIHSTHTNLTHAIEGQFDWGDGSLSGWIASGPFTASHTWTTEGTYVVRYEARCSLHNSISASADSLVVTITTTAIETISKPDYLSYSYSLTNPEINIPKTYHVYGGASSLGHDQEVMVDWGDGTQTGWVANGAGVSKTWTVAGTYDMIRQSRCIEHPTAISEWSDPTIINAVAPEAISTPVAPPGPTVGNRYVNMTYVGRGASGNWHASSWIEYRFDWGDGSALTDWSADTTVVHQFAAIGDYEVTAQARCAFPGHGEPESGWSLPTAVSIVEKVTIYQYGPIGPAYGSTTESQTFEAYHAAYSDAGHLTFEYQFDWGDGTLSDWSSSMSAGHTYSTAGSYELYYRARCAVDTDAVSDWSAQRSYIEITADLETISTPDIPGHYPPGTQTLVGVELQISTSHSSSNHGHPIEFQFDYGDGTTSPWTAGTPWSSFYQLTLYHPYTSIGSYDVTAKARCATHTTVESAVTLPHTIDVYEDIPVPGIPTGPATGIAGANLTFTTTGTTSSEGHALEYSFEYRIGSYTVVHTSDWSASLTDDYVFTQTGTFRVRVKARCATHTNVVTNLSGPLDVVITN